jgi:F-type H+-transporting ATPase subunit delta
MRRSGRKNYAKAIIEVGKEQNNVDSLVKNLETVEKKFSENKEIVGFLNDPQIDFEIKKTTIGKVFGESLNRPAVNFLYILIKNKNLDGLGDILDEARGLIREERNILEVTAVSSTPISEDIQGKIRNVLRQKVNKEITIKNQVDESLIGGLVLKIGDLVIDGSIHGKIQRLKYKIKQIS